MTLLLGHARPDSITLVPGSTVIGVAPVSATSWLTMLPASRWRLPGQGVSAAMVAGVAPIAAVDAGNGGKSGHARKGASLRHFYAGIATMVSIFIAGGLGYVHQVVGHE